MKEILQFPLTPLRKLTFKEAVGEVSNRFSLHPVDEYQEPQGLIVGYDQDGDIFILNFGLIKRETALWLGHQLIRHAQGEDIS